MYRKEITGILIICTIVIFGMTGELNAQNKPVSSTEVPGTITEVSLKNNKVSASQPLRGEDIVWKRDVYRIIDLKADQNGALYYPIEPDENNKNLFCMMFGLLANNQINAYEYIDGKEVFTDSHIIKFKDILKAQDIIYKEKKDPKNANASIYDIEPSDVPSSEVTQFYVKEIWFLDQRNSSIKVKTVALCPLLIREDETGEPRSYPLFWIPFETLKPFLSQMSIVADSLNSASRLSVYDYFNQRRYKGDIYKVSNLKNLNIMQYCKTPEEIKAEQQRLEKQLNNMGSTLWEPSQKLLREEAEQKKIKDREAKEGDKKKKIVK